MEKRARLRNRGIWVVVAVVGLVLLPGLASPEDCSVQCSVSSPGSWYVNYPAGISFQGSQTHTGNCCGLSGEWDFGDGVKRSPYSIDHTYVNPGRYTWTFKIWDSCDAQFPKCTRSGTVIIVPSNCSLSCTAQVTSVNEENLTVEFQGAASYTNCGTEGPLEIYYQWGWGDGDYSAITTSASASHTYKNPGTYSFTLYVRLGASASGVLRSCPGSVKVGCNGITVGGLKFCADTVTQDQDRYTLSGNVRINDILFFGGNVIFQGDPDSGQGTLNTNSSLYAKTARGNREILATGSYSFEVNGTNKTLLPNFGDGLTNFGFQVQGVPLAVKTWPIAFTQGGLRVDALLYVGVPGLATLSSVQLKFLFPPGGNEQIVGAEIVGVQITPSLTLVKADLTYDPVLDRLEGTLTFKFPWQMNLPDIKAGIRVVTGCLNYVGLTVGLPSAVSFGWLGGWKIAALTFEVDGICVAPFGVFFGGNVTYDDISGKLFVVEHIGLKWQSNNWWLLEVQGGTLKILGYPMASLVGRMRIDEPFLWVRGNLNIADVLQGNANLGFVLQSLRAFGNGKLALRLPDLPCSPINIACRTMASWLKSRVQLPVTLADVEMDLKVRWDITTIPPVGYIEAQGLVGVGPGPIGLAALVQVGTDGIHVSIGNNYEDLISIVGSSKSIVSKSIAGSITGAERTVVLNAPQPAVMFSVLSDTALPSIYLKTPDGKTITPANVASFPGVTYVGDAEGRVALFGVLNAQAGTWIIGEDSLPPESVSFAALGPVPAPQTAFTSVTKIGNTVSISASVTPAGANTKVGFYYTKVLNGTVEGVIAENLDAASGTVSAVWDTSKVPPGTYYLVARTEDGKNPPQIKVYDGSFPVNPAALAPPTGLTGTRDGETASLSWTASTSSGVIGYDVLYTDHPNEAGYPFSMTIPVGSSATVTDLDPAKWYRFCVVAFDENGQYSSESNMVTFGTGIPGDCDMNGAVSVWEVQGVINMFLGTSSPGCGADENEDGVVSIDEVQKVINQYLQGP